MQINPSKQTQITKFQAVFGSLLKYGSRLYFFVNLFAFLHLSINKQINFLEKTKLIET